MAKFDIKTVKPKFVVTTSPENKIDVVVNKPIITSKVSKSFFKLKNTGGPKGVKGDKGEPGQDSTIEVVSTTTGAAGTNASVVNQGTASAAQLAFTIPRGDKGDKGNDGAAGYSPTATVSKSGDTATITITDKNGTTTASISDGQDGAAGAPGQDGQSATIEVASTSTLPAGSSATVTNVGTSSAARLAFGIPKGDTGAAGADGDAATITVGQVETLQPNQSAYVTNVGTSEAAIFNIGIPKGDKGDSGSGSGDMTASVYDPNGTVAAAGGIPDYVAGELPTVNDATLTIQKNGTTVNTFTANSSSNVTANITVPTDTSDLTNGAGYITSSALPTKTSDLQNDGADGTSTYVEADDLATVATSGAYNDLSGKPTIPTVNNGTLTVTQNGTSKGTFTANSSSNETIALTDTTYSDFTGATSLAAGAAGLVPAPTTSDPDKFLKGDGTWATVQAGSSGLVLYANNSLHTPSSITGVYTNSGLTTMANTSDIIATIDDGGSVVIKYSTDEAVALTSYDDHASGSPSTISFTGQFLSNWKTNSPEFIKFIYNSTTSTWSAEGASLPTVNDATLTIQKNGTDVQTFTANQSTNATANIIVPTQFSDLSGTVGTTQIADGAVTAAKLYDRNTANTADTWMLVLNGDKIQHRVVKAFNADGSIPKTALAGMPCPDYANVITTWGDISATVTKTTTASGYIVGKCLIIGARQRAYIEINGIPVGGIPYNDTSQVNNLQVAFCIPVANNTEVTFYSSGTNGRFEGCKLVGWKLG